MNTGTIEAPATPTAGTTAPGALRAAGRTRALRRLGNLLIAAGLLLMLGVGGYLAVQFYTTNQDTEAITQQHQAAAGLDLGPPALPAGMGAGTTAGGATGATSGAAMSAAPAAPASDVVRVDQSPLASLNTGVPGAAFAGLAPSEPPVKITVPSVGIATGIVPISWEMIPGKDGQASSQWKVAEYAAGHHQGTSNPGQIGNMVISGHDDWKGEVFKNLHEVKRGDEIQVYTADREYLYLVQDIQLVLQDGATDEQKRQNARYMDPTPDQTLTLITCFPYGIDDHRLIVIAKPYDSGLPSRPDLVVK